MTKYRRKGEVISIFLRIQNSLKLLSWGGKVCDLKMYGFSGDIFQAKKIYDEMSKIKPRPQIWKFTRSPPLKKTHTKEGWNDQLGCWGLLICTRSNASKRSIGKRVGFSRQVRMANDFVARSCGLGVKIFDSVFKKKQLGRRFIYTEGLFQKRGRRFIVGEAGTTWMFVISVGNGILLTKMSEYQASVYRGVVAEGNGRPG